MLNRLIRLTFTLFLFLLPLYFLPIGGTSIESDKQAIVVFFSLFLFLLFTVKITVEKRITLVRTPLDFLLLFFSLTFLASTFFSAPNKIESLASPMATGTILATTLLYFLLTQVFSSPQPICLTGRQTTYNLQPLIFSSSLVSLLVLLQQLPIRNSQFVIRNLSPLGGPLPTFSFLLVVSVYLGGEITQSYLRGEDKNLRGFVKLFSFLLITSTVILSAFHLATDQKPLLLPFAFGWNIMMEMYKNIPIFLLGVGPANFITAFTLGKPAALNLTPFWNAVAFTSSNLPLTMATEVGSIAVFIFILLVIKVSGFFNFRKEGENSPAKISLLAALFLQFLFPSNVALLTLTFILAALNSPKWETGKLNLPSSTLISLFPFIFLIPLFFQGKIYLADIYYRRSLVSINNQRVADAFGFSQRAIRLNPASDLYYSFSSSLSLNIARNLAQEKEATESGRQQQIAQLTQQAINHARRATELNRLNSQNWTQLASVYQALIGTIRGAEQLALDSLNQQILLDPTSPQPKLTAGGLLMSAGQYDQAQFLFNQAISLKPDWNNAHYNLAVLLSQKQNYQAAAAELQTTLDLTSSNNQDYKKVQQELSQLQNLLSQQATPSAGSGQAPSAEATPSAKNQKTSKTSLPK